MQIILLQQRTTIQSIHKWIVLNDVSALLCVLNFIHVPKNLVFSMLCMVIWHFVLFIMLGWEKCKIHLQQIQFYLYISGAESMKLNLEVSNSNYNFSLLFELSSFTFQVVFINLSWLCGSAGSYHNYWCLCNYWWCLSSCHYFTQWWHPTPQIYWFTHNFESIRFHFLDKLLTQNCYL